MRRSRKGMAGRTAALVAVLAVVLLASAAVASAKSNRGAAAGRWLSGDIHTHTYLTDGVVSEVEVVHNGFGIYGLDYFANSEHGGTSVNDPTGIPFEAPVWRWVTLANYSYPIINDLREAYPERALTQGLEWNAPNHEHVSVGIVGAENEPSAISDFEYRFDAADTDLSRANEGTKEISHTETDPVTGQPVKVIDVPAIPFSKLNAAKSQPSDVDNTVVGVDWLQQNYGTQAYAVVNHPSRVNAWSVGDLRAMNDAAPDVAFGMEGLPGHQADFARGGYSYFIKADGTKGDANNFDPAMTAKARTYGGADYMTAKVGGLWDALLGEGRHFWIFNNSDFHRYSKSYKDKAGVTIGIQYYDFWPGQYARTWTFAKKDTPPAVVDGMRSGNVFVVNGDLIDGLKFTVGAGGKTSTMGQTFRAKPGQTVTVTVSVHSPRENANGDRPVVDHIDLIGGDVSGMVSPNGPDYDTKDTNSSTHVIKTFAKSSWKTAAGGWRSMTFSVKTTADMYFRLRGTNLAPGTANETDAAGNPLNDELSYAPIPNPVDGGATMTSPVNSPELAWSDLWFYSNPIFLTTGTPAG
jgi:hypothetical protein